MTKIKSRISIYEILVAVSFSIPLPFANALSFGAILALPILANSNFMKLKAAKYGVIVGVACLLNGFILLRFRNDVLIDRIQFLNITATMLNLILLAMLLFCFFNERKFYWFIIFFFGGKIVVSTLLSADGNFDQLWKYSIGIPITFVIFYLLKDVRLMGSFAGLVLAFLSLSAEYRSLTLIILITLVISTLSAISRTSVLTSERSIIKIIRGGSLFTFLVIGGSSFFSSGLTSAQSFQINGISAGRIEFVAGLKFMANNFFGFGIGAKPSGELLQVLRESFVSTGVGLESSYLSAYLLRDTIKFHSFILDSWSYFGFFGFILGMTAALVIGRSLLKTISSPNQSKHHIFLLLIGLWDVLYSPFTSNGSYVIVALVLSLRLETFRKDVDIKLK